MSELNVVDFLFKDLDKPTKRSRTLTGAWATNDSYGYQWDEPTFTRCQVRHLNH